jgi:hypothetical protein
MKQLIALVLLAAVFVAACEPTAPQTNDEQPTRQAPSVAPLADDTTPPSEEQIIVREPAPVEEKKETQPREEESPPKKTLQRTEENERELDNYLDAVSVNAIILFDTNARGPLVSAATNIIAYKEFPSGLEADAIDTSEVALSAYEGRDLVLLGDACNNAFVAAFLSTDEGCVPDVAEGEARISVLEEDGRAVIIIIGSDETTVHHFVEELAQGNIVYTGSERSWFE